MLYPLKSSTTTAPADSPRSGTPSAKVAGTLDLAPTPVMVAALPRGCCPRARRSSPRRGPSPVAAPTAEVVAVHIFKLGELEGDPASIAREGSRAPIEHPSVSSLRADNRRCPRIRNRKRVLARGRGRCRRSGLEGGEGRPHELLVIFRRRAGDLVVVLSQRSRRSLEDQRRELHLEHGLLEVGVRVHLAVAVLAKAAKPGRQRAPLSALGAKPRLGLRDVGLGWHPRLGADRREHLLELHDEAGKTRIAVATVLKRPDRFAKDGCSRSGFDCFAQEPLNERSPAREPLDITEDVRKRCHGDKPTARQRGTRAETEPGLHQMA